MPLKNGCPVLRNVKLILFIFTEIHTSEIIYMMKTFRIYIILSLFYRYFIRTQRVNSSISQKQFMFVVCKKVYSQTRLYWSHIGTSRSDSRYPKLRIRNNKCNEFDTEYCREPHECSLYPWFRIQYLCS